MIGKKRGKQEISFHAFMKCFSMGFVCKIKMRDKNSSLMACVPIAKANRKATEQFLVECNSNVWTMESYAWFHTRLNPHKRIQGYTRDEKTQSFESLRTLKCFVSFTLRFPVGEHKQLRKKMIETEFECEIVFSPVETTQISMDFHSSFDLMRR